MFTKKSSLILSAVLATFLTSASFPTMASSEAGLPEKSTLKAGSRWEQMIKKQQEEAAAEAAAKKKAALDREFKSMGKEVPTAKEPPAHKSLTYPQRLEKRNEELRKEKCG